MADWSAGYQLAAHQPRQCAPRSQDQRAPVQDLRLLSPAVSSAVLRPPCALSVGSGPISAKHCYEHTNKTTPLSGSVLTPPSAPPPWPSLLLPVLSNTASRSTRPKHTRRPPSPAQPQHPLPGRNQKRTPPGKPDKTHSWPHPSHEHPARPVHRNPHICPAHAPRWHRCPQPAATGPPTVVVPSLLQEPCQPLL